MMSVTILGCGPSPGVPLIGNYWGACDPKNPKNRRTRSSILIQKNNKNIVIDTAVDFRQQLLRENIAEVDAVLYTHAHADHCHGINDLFCLGRFQKKTIPIYADSQTLLELKDSFSYAFHDENENNRFYRPYLEAHEITQPSFMLLETVKVHHFEQDHGHTKSYGYRFDSFAYTTDVIGFPESSWKILEGVETWVVDCLTHTPHETHAHLDLVLSWIDRLQPRQTYLTHLGSSMDYETLRKRLPKGVYPCYDGLTFEA